MTSQWLTDTQDSDYWPPMGVMSSKSKLNKTIKKNESSSITDHYKQHFESILECPCSSNL